MMKITTKPPYARRIQRGWMGLICLVIAASGAHAQPGTNTNGRRESIPRIHDPSTIVREGDNYWMFATGNGIPSFSSTNLHDWRPGPPVMPDMPDWVHEVVPDQRGHYWAPDIIRVGNRWLLFYSVSSFGKNTSAIALASNASLDPTHANFGWRDEGIIIRTRQTNNFNAIDPAVFQDADQRLWLAFGSYWSGLKLIELDPATGKRIAENSPLHSLAANDNIEAAFIHRRGTNYSLFLNWGVCCRGTNSTYEIRVGRSSAVTGPYLDRDGKGLLAGGGTLVLSTEGRFIGPGHAGIVSDGSQEWFSFHYYNANNRGRPALGLRKLQWDDAGWPRVEGAGKE
jgi:arabinan endo-1,5-alpha-L-arabinosidase